jgi:membrane protease YdiL (CAAX protease family)
MQFSNRPALLPFLQNASTSMQLTALLFICIISGALFMFISAALGLMIWNLPIDAIEQYSKYGDAGIQFLKFSQLLTSVGLFVVPPIVFTYLSGHHPFKFLKMDRLPLMVLCLSAMILMWVQLPWINAVGAWNNSIVLDGQFAELYQSLRAKEDAATAMIEAFLEMNGPLQLVFTFFLVAIVPAVGEEMLFRGVLQPVFVRVFKNQHVGIFVTAFVFSFIHFQFFGFVPRLLIGVYLGYLFAWTGNIWYPILAHLANNGIAVIGYYMLQHKYIEVSPDAIGTGEMSVLQWMPSVVLTIVGLIFFKRAVNRLQQPEVELSEVDNNSSEGLS